jgi:hypothetical protein
MKSLKFSVLIVVLAASLSGFGCGESKKEKLRNGVTFATSALQQAGANPLSQATYRGYIDRGLTPVDYIKAVLPKTDPPFDSYEFENPTHPWTVVIRPGTETNVYYVEGYGDDVKEPLYVETVTVNLPEPEE